MDLDNLYRYIMNHVSMELSNLVESCYYPKTSNIFKELLYMCNTNEKLLLQYSLEKYGQKNSQFKLAHDPFTTLLILIVQEFLKVNNLVAAQTAFHLLSLRTYSNTLYHFTTSKKNGNKKALCIPDIFQQALESLSNNHIFKKKQSIAASIIYFSSTEFSKFKQSLIIDDSNRIFMMIYSLKNRIKQSIKSMMVKYYEIYNKKINNTTGDETDWDTTKETKLRSFIDKIVEDMCVYKKRNSVAIQQATYTTKFNKKLSVQYAEAIAQPAFIDLVKLSYYVLLRPIQDLSIIRTTKFLDLLRSLMAIKSTKQKVYFKKTVDDIQNLIIEKLNLEKWYTGLTIQSKSVSRNWIAYYLAFYLRYYV